MESNPLALDYDVSSRHVVLVLVFSVLVVAMTDKQRDGHLRCHCLQGARLPRFCPTVSCLDMQQLTASDRVTGGENCDQDCLRAASTANVSHAWDKAAGNTWDYIVVSDSAIVRVMMMM